mmetsp:Transcript_67817/g.196146  ORF Transcript_67817/g.196146 Transcript_67817/m.196146 type:complete len:218 (-) Transcript_67817:82-735(-)
MAEPPAHDVAAGEDLSPFFEVAELQTYEDESRYEHPGESSPAWHEMLYSMGLAPPPPHLWPLALWAEQPPQQIPQTTMVLKNVPCNYDRQKLLGLLDAQGFRERYDFVYLPIDFCKGGNYGYCNINFVDEASATEFATLMHDFSDWEIPSKKRAIVEARRDGQGREFLVEYFRNSDIMHKDVPDEFRPLLLENGQKVAFPAPTKRPKRPKGFPHARG